jgi:alpha-L-rhamnosidase
MGPLKPPAFPSLVITATALAALALPARAAGGLLSEPDLVHEAWPADWIACAGAGARDPGVYHFRKWITVGEVPGHFIIHVSADNRFILFVNGTRVGDGPARGDLDHWRYETFDISRMLRTGDNVLAATVWNYGALAPTAQMSDQTGFLIQGDTNAERSANTGTSWEAEREKGQNFEAISSSDLPNYYAASPGETLDGTRYDWEWQTAGPAWKSAITVGTGEPGRYPKATPVGTGSGVNRWLLVQDTLPPMEYSETSIGRIVRVEGAGSLEKLPTTVPAHAKVSLLFDRGSMTTGYPDLVVSHGRGARVKITYAEALVDSRGRKGNRNEIAGRHILGLTDTVISDGGTKRSWSPLWWRSWRYLQLDIQTGDEAIAIDSLGARFSGYPFKERGAFAASDPSLSRIWEVGTRTARMNAHETYMDCAYWEQLQYIGDTRIQALISYVQFGDDRLARQALEAYDNSRIAEGLSQSRYPSALNQVIPTFSLLWIGMLHDFWMYRPDNGSLAQWVPHTRSVIEWYARHQRPDGLLGRMPWWNFGDWTKDFVFGEPPQDADGGSALLSLYYMAALRDAADLEEYLGNGATAEADRQRAAGIGRAVHDLCWNSAHGLLADTPAHAHFSEQTNTLGVLLDVVPKGTTQENVMRAVLGHKPAATVPGPGEFSPASVYFRFYVARAMDHAGLSDLYLDSLGPWRSMLDIGLTTFAETAEPTRSDDHAWSAHPDYDLLTLVAGIRPASAGFRTVLIEPHPSSLTEINATMPHPAGDIAEHARKETGGWVFDISLPPGLTGTMSWDGRSTPLSPGPNHLDFRR